MDLKYPVSSHSLTLMRNSFGWIELFNETDTVGFIYLEDPPTTDDHIGNRKGKVPYVVTSQTFSSLSVLLTVLNQEQGVTIRFTEAGEHPAAFLETANSKTHLQNFEDPKSQ